MGLLGLNKLNLYTCKLLTPFSFLFSEQSFCRNLSQIQDASLGGSSDDEDFLGVLRGPSTFANAFLYVGLGTIALGLVIAFVGTGEKGFKTVELRLIGPSLIGNKNLTKK